MSKNCSPFRAKINKLLANVWRPSDWFQLSELVEQHYYRKACVFADFRPRRVIEIGTRCGYSLACFNAAFDQARFLCIDGAMDEDSLDCLTHWQTVVHSEAIDADLIVVDSHALRSLPHADFAHVDGDHSYQGALADLRLVAHCPTILADDCDNPDVRRAVEEFAIEKHRRFDFHDDGLRTSAVIQ